VRFKVLFCGICHSDLHMAKNEWGTSMYPLVPGYVHTVRKIYDRIYSYFSFFFAHKHYEWQLAVQGKCLEEL